jgi:predicted nuclease with RNAse H fold
VTSIGIDVGGARKGFHAVALRDGADVGQMASCDEKELAHWCVQQMQAQVIAIDAPCRWSSDGRARSCERELRRQGIVCFASPTREAAVAHPTNWYGWMLRGEALYQALEPTHPLCTALPIAGQRCCFETFPHAITWQLHGGRARAAHKRAQRRQLLAQAGLDPARFTSIDWIDAALCALTAHHAASGGDCVGFGEPETGWIVVPSRRDP